MPKSRPKATIQPKLITFFVFIHVVTSALTCPRNHPTPDSQNIPISVECSLFYIFSLPPPNPYCWNLKKTPNHVLAIPPLATACCRPAWPTASAATAAAAATATTGTRWRSAPRWPAWRGSAWSTSCRSYQMTTASHGKNAHPIPKGTPKTILPNTGILSWIKHLFLITYSTFHGHYSFWSWFIARTTSTKPHFCYIWLLNTILSPEEIGIKIVIKITIFLKARL